MLRIPALNNRIRLLAILYGVVLLLWLSAEDNDILRVTLLGTVGAVLTMGLWLLDNYGGKRISRRVLQVGGVFIGAMTGAGAVLATVALMFLKTAWHSHVFPDYPAQMMLDMLTRLPVWALAGGLIGLAGMIMFLAFFGHKAEIP